MSENAKEAWSTVGERFASWGQRVVDRYKEAGSPDATPADSQHELERAAKELVDEIGRGFSAVSRTLRDDAANQDLGAAVSAIGDAIKATVDEAKQGLRSGDPDQKPDDH